MDTQKDNGLCPWLESLGQRSHGLAAWAYEPNPLAQGLMASRMGPMGHVLKAWAQGPMAWRLESLSPGTLDPWIML